MYFVADLLLMPKRMLAITIHPTTVSDLSTALSCDFLGSSDRIRAPDLNPVRQNRLTFETAVDDVGAPSKSGNFRGHGTQVAILAAGCKTGVARNANLYLIKFIEVKMKSGIAVETQSSPAAQIQGLRQIISVVQGSVAGVSVPRGKAVLVLSAGRWKEDDMKRAHGNNWEVTKNLMTTALEQLDQLGVTVVLAAGNDGASSNPQQNPNFAPLYIDQHFPLALATANSPILAVGSTNNKGQLSVFSTPGRGYTPVSLYAQGEGVSTYDLLESGPTLKSGTSYAAPIVVCAVYLKFPSPWG